MHMQDDLLEALDSNQRKILRVSLAKNKTFLIQINVFENQCLSTKVVNESWLWHLRFGHLNFKSLSLLKSKQMVTRHFVIQTPQKVYSNYLINKQPKNSFSSYISRRATGLFGVVHSDVCGPFMVPSLGGNNILFPLQMNLAECCGSFLSSPSQKKFQSLRILGYLLKSNLKKHIKILRTDGGVELSIPLKSLKIIAKDLAFNMK